jgi:hypothetical protein
MWGQPITVEYQQTDVSLYTTSTSKPPTSSATAPPARTTKSDIPAETAPLQSNLSEEPQAGLSTGAKAGIGVAAAVIVLGLIGFLVWFMKRRSHRSQLPKLPELSDSEILRSQGYYGSDKVVYQKSAPLQPPINNDPVELDASHGHSELDQDAASPAMLAASPISNR